MPLVMLDCALPLCWIKPICLPWLCFIVHHICLGSCQCAYKCLYFTVQCISLGSCQSAFQCFCFIVQCQCHYMSMAMLQCAILMSLLITNVCIHGKVIRTQVGHCVGMCHPPPGFQDVLPVIRLAFKSIVLGGREAAAPLHTHGRRTKLGHKTREWMQGRFYVQMDMDDMAMLIILTNFQKPLKEWLKNPLPIAYLCPPAGDLRSGCW